VIQLNILSSSSAMIHLTSHVKFNHKRCLKEPNHINRHKHPSS